MFQHEVTFKSSPFYEASTAFDRAGSWKEMRGTEAGKGKAAGYAEWANIGWSPNCLPRESWSQQKWEGPGGCQGL